MRRRRARRYVDGMVPAFAAAALGVNAPNALVVSQTALSVAPAVPMISLAAASGRRDIVGKVGQTPADRRAPMGSSSPGP